MKQYIFVIDCDRCIGCKGCQIACKLENAISLGQGRNKVCTIGPNGTFPDLEMYFMPAMCQQCEGSVCTAACPTGACFKDEADGIIKIDRSKCIACGKCKTACPYDCISLNSHDGFADKCDLCAAKTDKGEAPACVKNCSAGALFFGDINDSESEVSKLLSRTADEHIHTLRDYGNAPRVRYILRRGTWHDILPQDCIEHSVWKKGGRKA